MPLVFAILVHAQECECSSCLTLMQCLPALLTHHFLVPPIAFLILPNIHDPCLHIPNIFALPVPTLLQVRRDRALAETLADDGKRFDAVDVLLGAEVFI